MHITISPIVCTNVQSIPLGTAAGYILGGLIAPAFGWRAPFFMQVPVPCCSSCICLVGTADGRRNACNLLLCCMRTNFAERASEAEALTYKAHASLMGIS